MRFRSSKNSRTAPQDSQISMDAAEWLLRLQDTDVDAEEPYPDALERQNAFFKWLTQSPAHVRAFLEIMEVERRAGHPDPQRLIKIQELLEASPADVIQLFEPPPGGDHRLPRDCEDQRLPADSLASSQAMPTRTAAAKATPGRRRKVFVRVAAVFLICAVATTVYLGSRPPNDYITGIGEQRTCKLRDGSVIVLNTDTEVQVDYSKHLRGIRLVKGEALFMVEHDASRPFIVSAGSANVRAVGTQFNVRRREQSTEVAVVEGVVQVSTAAATPLSTEQPEHANPADTPPQGRSVNPAAIRLAAGEKAQVSTGGMKISTSHDIEGVLSWRQRRLTFRDTPLADVVAEFNRYNHSQIRIEGSAAQDMQMTGIFDADHPQAIILFAQKNDTLTVAPEGEDWVIRSRE
ncbi:MAG: FecR family protein [Steroidobacteraceae bacterium]